MAASPPPTCSVEGFLAAAARSRLFPPGELDRRVAPLPTRDPAAVAGHLVRAGVLTRFQADKLLAGQWHALAVGPYRLLCPLGRGGMGVVYLARDVRRDAQRPVVALKVLAPLRAEPTALARFRREMEIGPTLPAHPRLARTTEAGQIGGVHFLAMEAVSGKNVRRTVADGGPLPVGTACRVIADAAAGLAAAHAAGVVHRDVTPANIVVTPDGRGVVLDWGFALRVGEAADPAVVGGRGRTVGTLNYLAPEQAQDAARVGPPADVYSLGCTLFLALTGCPPFPGGEARDKFRWHRSAAPPAASGINPAVPAGLDEFLRRMLAKSPAGRPTADEAAAGLAVWTDPTHDETPPPGQTEDEMVLQAEAGWQAQAAEPDPPGVRLPVGWRGLAVGAGLGVGVGFLAGVVAGKWAGF